MKRWSRKRLLVAACVLAPLLVGIGGTIWLANRAVAWARDLPNRIHIQIDGRLIADAAAESIRTGLRSAGSANQLQALRSIAEMMQAPEAIPWVSAEFREELESLKSSPDLEIAAQAEALLNGLDDAGAAAPPN